MVMLSNEDRYELRKSVEVLLGDVTFDSKIKLPKEILEQLLFEEVVYCKDKKIKIKLPVWSGDFLSKLDLSEVNFSNVSWSMLACYKEIVKLERLSYDDNYENAIKGVWSYLEKYCGYSDDKSFIINYSNTNANIDLSKSIECNYNDSLIVKYCNFSGCDFSKLDFSSLNYIYILDSNFSNTGITFVNGNLKKVNLINSNFDNTNLSNLIHIVNLDNNIYYDLEKGTYINSNFRIIFSLEDMLDCFRNNYNSKMVLIDFDYFCFESFSNIFKKGNLDGCYFNNILIDSKLIEEFNSFEDIKAIYFSGKSREVIEVLSIIEEQIKNLDKNKLLVKTK